MGAAHPNSTSLTIYWLSVYSVATKKDRTKNNTRTNSGLSFEAKKRRNGSRRKEAQASERSEFLRFRREPIRSRLKTEAGVFSFCYLFLFDAKKKK